jgi:hypothetical protein
VTHWKACVLLVAALLAGNSEKAQEKADPAQAK